MSKLRDEGIEGAVLMMRRAEIAHARMQLVIDTLRERGGKSRLADARLTRDQHHPPFAGLRLLPAAGKQLDFLVTTHERRRPRAQGFKPAQHPALANDPPGRLRLGKAGEYLRAEFDKIEQPADLPARRF